MRGVKSEIRHYFYIFQLVICTFGGIKNKHEYPENNHIPLPSQDARSPYSGRHS
jgi:hypothetical protein